ncbi:SDR family NAD(P)-dependent oxidoreductase [Paenarthrobacter sp. NPDC058040]|uniref:SDR family NAD(P)-dependent oxidoreductase n=1 Tax=unclassified Paenarthrobacter TaxID=2634190 RepID=UPI0036DBC6E7
MRFESKVVLITGAASGIGRAAAERFAEEGASVVAVDINRQAGETTAHQLRDAGYDVAFLQASVTAEKEVERLFAQVKTQYGRLDVLFNNAGIAEESFVVSTKLDDWRRVMAVNVDGAFLMSKHAIRLMLESGDGGAIVNTSSILGHVGFAGAASYNVSKHAVEGLTKSLALEHAGDGIRVNSVCPGWVNTPMGMADVELDPTIPSQHPIGRIAEPREIAAAVAFLAGDDASFITGTSLMVDGGITARP